MTLKQTIDCADRLSPNKFSNDEKTEFINDVELTVQRRILGIRAENVRKYVYNTDKNNSLMLGGCMGGAPYLAYLCAMTHLSNFDSELYSESYRVFENAMSEVAFRYIRFYTKREREWIAAHFTREILSYLADPLMNGRLQIVRDGKVTRLCDRSREILNVTQTKSGDEITVVSPYSSDKRYTASITAVNCTLIVYAVRSGSQVTIADSASVYPGEKVYWNAVPDEGYQISGATSGEITVSGNITVSVTATVAKYSLAVSASHCTVTVSVIREDASVELSVGDDIYHGETLTWSAVADSGYSVASSGTFTVNGETLTVTASPTAYVLTVSASHCSIIATAVGMGSSRMVTNGGAIYYGETVNWVATPSDGYYLTQNTGSITVDGNEIISVSATASPVLTVTATHCTVTVIGSVSGNLSNGDCLVPGETLSWTAVAESEYYISDATSGTVVVSGDTAITVTAEYHANMFELTVSAEHATVSATVIRDGVSHSLSSGDAIFLGEYITWLAVADFGYEISGQASGGITVDGNESISISTTRLSYTLWISQSNCVITANVTRSGEQVALSNGAVIYYGELISWSAVASTGYEITGQSSGTVSVDGNESLTVSAVKIAYELTVQATNCTVAAAVTRDGSSVALSSGSSIYFGEVVSWTATASDGYRLETSSGSVTVDGNETISVSAISNQVTVSTAGFEHVVNRNSTSTAEYGTDCEIYVDAESGYALPTTISMTIGGATAYAGVQYDYYPVLHKIVINGEYITGNVVITAVGTHSEYTVTYTVTNGSLYVYVTRDGVDVRLTSGSAIYTGETVYWQITPDSGYEFPMSTGSNYVDGNVEYNFTCTLQSGYTITIVPVHCTLSVYLTRGGSREYLSSGDSIYAGETVYWDVEADPGYYIAGSGYGSAPVTGNLTVRVEARYAGLSAFLSGYCLSTAISCATEYGSCGRIGVKFGGPPAANDDTHYTVIGGENSYETEMLEEENYINSVYLWSMDGEPAGYISIGGEDTLIDGHTYENPIEIILEDDTELEIHVAGTSAGGND